MFVALTVAGSDSSGGAGIQADLKTFQAYHVYGASVITAVTSQNTLGVRGIQGISPEMIKSQMISVFGDLPVKAVKTGMLYSEEIIRAFLEVWRDLDKTISASLPLVVDPVMVSTSGDRLLSEDAVSLYFELFREAKIITPNLPEASVLTGKDIKTVSDVKDAALFLHDKTHSNILIKGGHGIKDENEALDIYYDGKEFSELRAEIIRTKNTHGTGCTLSAAITACLAKGYTETDAINDAKKFVTGAIQHAPGLGSGQGPLNHMWRQRPDIA